MPASKNPARKGKKPAAQTNEARWYTIRRILDEKRIAKRIQYLVDWDDDADTGEQYEPTWAWVSFFPCREYLGPWLTCQHRAST